MRSVLILCLALTITPSAFAQDYFSTIGQREHLTQEVKVLLAPVGCFRLDLDSPTFYVRESANQKILDLITKVSKEYPWAKTAAFETLTTKNLDRDKAKTEVFTRLRRLRSLVDKLPWNDYQPMIQQNGASLLAVLEELEIILGKKINYKADPQATIDIENEDPRQVLIDICNKFNLVPDCTPTTVQLRKADDETLFVGHYVVALLKDRTVTIGTVSQDTVIADLQPIVFHKDDTPILIQTLREADDTYTCHCDNQHCGHNDQERGNTKSALIIKTSHLLQKPLLNNFGKSNNGRNGLLLNLSKEELEPDIICLVSGGQNFKSYEWDLTSVAYVETGFQHVRFEKKKTGDAWTIEIFITFRRLPWSSTAFGEDRIYHSAILANEYHFYAGGRKLSGTLSPVHFREVSTFTDQYVFLRFNCAEEPTVIKGRIASSFFAEFMRFPKH